MKVDNDSDNEENVAKTKKELIKESLKTCPPIPPISSWASLILLLALIWGTLWGLMGPMALPQGPVFALFILVIFCYLGGQIVRLLKVPTLVGMMVAGFVLRNAPHINIAKDIPPEWASNIRNFALVLILLRAGLEVDSHVLMKNKGVCCRLIFIPFIIECCTGAVVGRYLLDLPWKWAFLLGFLLSAVSPAVVLPVMLKLKKKGIGTQNGVPTMVIAVAGIDDVLALTGFEVIIGIIFSTEAMSWAIGKGPLEILAGIAYGIVLGLIGWYIPNPEEKSTNMFRVLLLIFGGMFVTFGSQQVDWGAAGALGCICLPFVAAIRWKTQGWDHEHNAIGDSLAFIWRIIEPFLFGLVGTEIKIDELQPTTIGLGLATLFIALALRMVGSLVSSCCAGITVKEQIFITFAGVPKATVQAAIGPMALSLVRKNHLGTEWEEYGLRLVTVAVLAILFTAPLGATAISLLAPRLLGGDEKKQQAATNDSTGAEGAKPKFDADTRVSVFDTTSITCEMYTRNIEEGPSMAFGPKLSCISNGNVHSVERL